MLEFLGISYKHGSRPEWDLFAFPVKSETKTTISKGPTADPIRALQITVLRVRWRDERWLGEVENFDRLWRRVKMWYGLHGIVSVFELSFEDCGGTCHTCHTKSEKEDRILIRRPYLPGNIALHPTVTVLPKSHSVRFQSDGSSWIWLPPFVPTINHPNPPQSSLSLTHVLSLSLLFELLLLLLLSCLLTCALLIHCLSCAVSEMFLAADSEVTLVIRRISRYRRAYWTETGKICFFLLSGFPMDGQINPAKLTRTQSSLLRSSPTVRSIQSLSSVTEEDEIDQYHKNKVVLRSSPRTWSTCFTHPVLALASLACFTLFFVSCFCFFFYARKEEIATSENLLLALVFVAITLFFANRNKGLIQQTVSILKQSWDENVRRLGFSTTNAKPVKWFIGTPNSNFEAKKKSQIIREGVEFYSNGDFYEGEFHKGKCNGSGVYNYFANGRYEGDWIDGRYDGYGIESWARGSRYRGQYRQGLRHGFGIYRFYTGDSYAGEWYNGQSHGLGIQTCSDGSCYVGEFKYGAKHGLGCYHFRWTAALFSL